MSVKSPFPSDRDLKRPVCVFCGSSPGSRRLFADAAESVGKALADNGIPLVYGGGRRGIMGVVSKAVLEAGGYSHGVTPKALVLLPSEKEDSSKSEMKSKEGQGEEILDQEYDGRFTTEVTRSMHERKLKMAQYSTGGFVVLPGGYGTFEELMEMVTWNQLGIHSRPVIVLNIGNFYSPLISLLEGGASSGFIRPENLSLMRIVNLEGGESANSDNTKASEWGPTVIKALEEWAVPETAGYGLQWDDLANPVDEVPTPRLDEPSMDSTSLGMAISNANGASSASKEPEIQGQSFSLFTTMRYKSSGAEVDIDGIPLLNYHVDRLREAHEHFSKRKGKETWEQWPGDDTIREAIWAKLQDTETSQPGKDWRVRVLLHPASEIEIQAVPAPPGAGPFQLFPAAKKGKTRTLILDPQITDLSSSSSADIDFRLYKTTSRAFYDEATQRAENLTRQPHQEVLLHTRTHILETSTSNIAIYSPDEDDSKPPWVTPSLIRHRAPFLNGVMRRYLLQQGLLREAEITVSDFERMTIEGRRVIGFNGLRGVWEAEVHGQPFS